MNTQKKIVFGVTKADITYLRACVEAGVHHDYAMQTLRIKYNDRLVRMQAEDSYRRHHGDFE